MAGFYQKSPSVFKKENLGFSYSRITLRETGDELFRS